MCFLLILPTAVAQFFSAYQHPLSLSPFQKLLAQIISSAKSSNVAVRTNSVELFKVLIKHADPSDSNNLARVAVPDLVALPKTGKSAGPEHRVALYSMLALLSPGEDVSLPIVQATTGLIAKEQNEQATAVLAGALPTHIGFLLREGKLPVETMQLISKEVNNAKPAVRRAFVGLAGAIFYEGQSALDSPNAVAFAKNLMPAFEACLKSVSTNPLNVSGGPYEGYVALSILLGPFARSKQFGRSKPFAFLCFMSESIIPRFDHFSKCGYYSYRRKYREAILLAVG